MSDEFSKAVETSFDAWLAEDSTHWIGEQDAAWQAWMYVHEQTVEPLNAEIARLKAECESANSRLHEVAVACATAEQERDQLRAEIAGLRTGYEAYERVNAELKAEVEKLRKLAAELRGSAECHNVHHCKAEQHEFCEPCKVLARIDAALGQGERS